MSLLFVSPGKKVAIYEIYSKRLKRLKGELPDTYKYDEIPTALRVQICHIWADCFGVTPPGSYFTGGTITPPIYRKIRDALCREYGLFQLVERPGNAEIECKEFLLETPNVEEVLDIIELSFQAIEELSYENRGQKAIEELNARLREHGIGYHYESGQIMRLDCQYIHEQAVRPALHILSGKMYEGAQSEFLSAHEHYRHGRNEEALTDALKAFESTIKAICKKRKWPCRETDTAKKLIQVIFDKELVQTHLQSEFSALRSTLESGIPTLRNKESAHGAGSTPRNVPSHLAAYGLHMTAAAIVFLSEADANSS